MNIYYIKGFIMTWTDTDIAIGAVILIYLVAIATMGIFGEATAGDILLASVATIITIVGMLSIQS